jgi:hypothetical protein
MVMVVLRFGGPQDHSREESLDEGYHSVKVVFLVSREKQNPKPP